MNTTFTVAYTTPTREPAFFPPQPAEARKEAAPARPHDGPAGEMCCIEHFMARWWPAPARD